VAGKAGAVRGALVEGDCPLALLTRFVTANPQPDMKRTLEIVHRTGGAVPKSEADIRTTRGHGLLTIALNGNPTTFGNAYMLHTDGASGLEQLRVSLPSVRPRRGALSLDWDGGDACGFIVSFKETAS
jgi:hypothetical protein